MSKPEGRAQGHRRRASLELVTVAAVDVPDRPTGLLKVTAEAWDVYWRSEVAAVTSEVDMPAIRRLFGMYDAHERARRVAKRKFVVEGSKGQPRINPVAEHALKLDAAILRLENELGLTPMSRARLGLTIGAMRRTLDDLNDRYRSNHEEGDGRDPRLAGD